MSLTPAFVREQISTLTTQKERIHADLNATIGALNAMEFILKELQDVKDEPAAELVEPSARPEPPARLRAVRKAASAVPSQGSES